jgi:proteasome assembly chaperone (PAC2) family protein
MIVGFPGVGHVGKLVAEHLVEELESTKIIEIYLLIFLLKYRRYENSGDKE